MKQLKRPLKGPSTAKYYPDHIEHFEKATLEMKRDLMFTDESEANTILHFC
ncbi:hypothetical protein SARC_05916 [Sphaeroforma arctica JP610]|uniref:Uncharacterized protein n=1 Tax=Sphaeroforma arctica JP610 TaxID=667725 RepID=A0A0L0G0N3_9EUKA|nr:hypothetical protein SARC_05916 [Sphaeroforma arctica JP610]KNC81768.1 hypothetical protein SARC_05916 [Sphaeroforma arctica JP610]|eukprot:XP_014155670.1 hypothetical protein SARC_05916 [Sphaeroforma arctica JP610]